MESIYIHLHLPPSLEPLLQKANLLPRLSTDLTLLVPISQTLPFLRPKQSLPLSSVPQRSARTPLLTQHAMEDNHFLVSEIAGEQGGAVVERTGGDMLRMSDMAAYVIIVADIYDGEIFGRRGG